MIIAFFLVSLSIIHCHVYLIILFLSFKRRWRRNHTEDPDFHPEDFVTSPTSEFRSTPDGSTHRVSTFDPVPPSMAYHGGHVSTSSVSSGPGMAGQGAFGSGARLQERPNYVYGQYDPFNARDDEANDIAQGGPYSSEPQPQTIYNPEVYGSYAPNDSNQGYQPHQVHSQAYAYSDNAAPALVPGAYAVPAGRSTRSMEHIDAYGGF
jgi:hypothetical protein